MSQPPNYGSMPAPPPQYGGAPMSKDPSTAPSTVINAVRIMYLVAALGLIGVIVLIADKGSLRDAVRNSDHSLDPSQVDSAVNIGLGVGIAIGIVFLVLYVLLAVQVRKGKNWARVVTWVFAGLGVLGNLTNLARPQASLFKVIAVVELVVEIALIVLLAMKPSNDYFRRPTY